MAHDMAPLPTSGKVRRLELVVCIGIILFGAAVRLPGLSGGDLWADDAWIALTAKVGLHQALQIAANTPLLGLLLRQWIAIDPGTTWFAQLLPMLAGLGAIPAVWWLARCLRAALWTKAVVALMAATAPAAILYGTRVKEYPFELLFGTLLMVGLAKTVALPDSRWRWVLVGGVLVACLSSGLLTVFSLAVVVALGVSLLRSTERPRGSIAALAIMVCCVAGSVLLLYRSVPPALQRFWEPWEIVRPLHRSGIDRSIALMGSGIAHGIAGIPQPTGPFPLTIALSNSQIFVGWLLAIVEVLLLLAAVLVVVRRLGARNEPAASVGLGAIGVLALAIAGAAVGKLPLGGGRTDLWWYPAVWALSILVLEALRSQLVGRQFAHRRASSAPALLAVGLVPILILASLGIWFRAWYPHQDIRSLVTSIEPKLRTGDWIVVGGKNQWTWAYDGVTPVAFHYDRHSQRWTEGFNLSVDRPPDAITRLAAGMPPACASTRRIWVIGYQASVASPSAYRLTGPAGRVDQSDIVAVPLLARSGFHLHSTVQGDGVYASLWTHEGPCT